MKIPFFALILIQVADIASATPVSFKDGWGIMPTYNEDGADIQVNYSLTSRYSLGFSDYYREGEDSNANFVIGQFNYLIKRWNELESQANVFASVGMGGRHDSIHDDGFAGYGALEANYETRRIYTLVAGETLQSANSVDFNKVRARVGIAPYIAPIESLQTWLIAQIEYTPEMDEETTVTPLLRFFYNNYSLEAGASLDGRPFLGAMVHF